jgi:hypothetical protein
MVRKLNQPAEMIDPTTAAHDATLSDSANELVLLGEHASKQAEQIAQQLGYEGSLSVGSLEDGIRFYQRRTVEACLELGKRLLLLKELTPHGEFETRADLLGFNIRTAQRFMVAALKTSKSANLSLLGTQVKSVSAFLELVTQDDDVLEALAEIDDIDRMPTSELRRTLRDLKANSEATDKLLAAKDKKINELSRKGQAVGFTDGVHVFSTLIEQIDAAKRQLKASYSEIDICISAALEVEGDEVDREGMNAARIALAQCIKDALDEPERMLQKVGKRFEDTIALLADEAAQ